MRIAITGHRPNKLWNDYDLVSPGMIAIRERLQRGIDKAKPTVMISGMALGIDTLWAELALVNGIKLIAAIPCQGHPDRWPQKSRDRYGAIIQNPLTEVVMVSNAPYNHSCMQKRNEWMVDNSDLLVAVWDGTPGGTKNCVDYAISQNKTMIVIDPKKLVER